MKATKSPTGTIDWVFGLEVSLRNRTAQKAGMFDQVDLPCRSYLHKRKMIHSFHFDGQHTGQFQRQRHIGHVCHARTESCSHKNEASF